MSQDSRGATMESNDAAGAADDLAGAAAALLAAAAAGEVTVRPVGQAPNGSGGSPDALSALSELRRALAVYRACQTPANMEASRSVTRGGRR